MKYGFLHFHISSMWKFFLCRLHHSDTSRVLSLFYRFILQYIGKREVRNGPSIPACTPWKETECAGDLPTGEQSMKILFVSDQYGAANNGLTISARRYAEVLRAYGHEVRVLSTNNTERDGYQVREMRIPVFDKLIKSQGMIFGRAEKNVVSEAIAWADVIHFYTPFALSMGVARMAKKAGKPATCAFHVQPQNVSYSIGMGKWEFVNTFIFWIFRVCFYNRFRYVHCPSRFIASELEAHHYKSKPWVISNGIDPDFVYHKAEKPAELRDLFRILMIGRLSREKRQDVLIDAVKKSKYRDRIRLELAGQGPRRSALLEQGRELGENLQIGFYSKPDLLDLISRCDLYVHAADAEIEAMSCMEAFAGGLVPVIANSRKSATPQFALDERSLFRAGDSTDLASKIDWWIEHPEKRREMERRYAEAAKKYALETCVSQFEELLHTAMREGSWL